MHPEFIERLLKRIAAGATGTFEDAATLSDYIAKTAAHMFCAGLLVGIAMSAVAWWLHQ